MKVLDPDKLDTVRVDLQYPRRTLIHLAHHLGKDRVTKADVRTMVEALFDSWLQDLEHDYTMHQVQQAERAEEEASFPAGYPHELGCQCCLLKRVCNYCGEPTVAATGRCTNGRCPTCCARHCLHKVVA